MEEKEDVMMNKSECIQFVGIKPTRALLRCVEKQVKKWINRYDSFESISNKVDYLVRIERDESHPHCLCAMRIRVAGSYLHSFETGRTVQEALKRAIERLQAVGFACRASGEVIAERSGAAQVA